MIYKRKPEYVEAVQWKGDNIDEVRRMIGDIADIKTDQLWPACIHIRKVDQYLIPEIGTYLTRNANDDIRNVSAKAFERDYEKQVE